MIDPRTGGSADIMRYADMALYRAKNEGRNRACVYDAVMDADLSQRKLIEQDLRETIENDDLKVLYQPIFNASGDKVVGVEALARWLHPTRGFIPPTEFIPIAEHSGLIIELGANVLRRACLDGMPWPGITVSVNVSPLQFRRLDFVSMVERILAETGFDPKRLELELTEIDAARQPRKRGSRDASAQGARRAALRSTISAPAIRACAICAASRSTSSRSTGASCTASRRRPTPPRSFTLWSVLAAVSA